MRRLAVVLVLVGCTGGGDSTGTSSGASSSSSGGTSSSSSSSSGTTMTSGSSGASSGGSSSGSTSACTGPMTILVKNGQTSSCSHPIPAAVGADRDNLNVYYSPSPGVTEKLCKTDRTSCEQFKGWFFLGDEIAFCDETCARIDEGPDSTFLVETGCPATSCF